MIIATARTLQDARRKERAATILMEDSFQMWASGLWRDQAGNCIFLDALPALVESIGYKWALIGLDEGLVKARPDPDSDYAEIHFTFG